MNIEDIAFPGARLSCQTFGPSSQTNIGQPLRSSFLLFRAILHDEETYANAFDFKPERFIAEENGGNVDLDPTVFTFGFGRRVRCQSHDLPANT